MCCAISPDASCSPDTRAPRASAVDTASQPRGSNTKRERRACGAAPASHHLRRAGRCAASRAGGNPAPRHTVGRALENHSTAHARLRQRRPQTIARTYRLRAGSARRPSPWTPTVSEQKARILIGCAESEPCRAAGCGKRPQDARHHGKVVSAPAHRRPPRKSSRRPPCVLRAPVLSRHPPVVATPH